MQLEKQYTRPYRHTRVHMRASDGSSDEVVGWGVKFYPAKRLVYVLKAGIGLISGFFWNTAQKLALNEVVKV